MFAYVIIFQQTRLYLMRQLSLDKDVLFADRKFLKTSYEDVPRHIKRYVFAQ